MDWEIINGITGIISAIGAFSGIGYVALSKPKAPSSKGVLSLYKLASFTIACCGWVLCCLAFLWLAEPYGPFMTDNEYKQFFGVILAFPAIVIFFFGVGLLQDGKHNKLGKRSLEAD